ncbi:MAG: BACON domain-containing protein [Alistipes sp.]|nr:BACON domain-containing protein [Alistipes sp.]
MKLFMQLSLRMCCCLSLLMFLGGCNGAEGEDAMLRLSAVGVAVGAEGDTKEISVATYPKGEDWDVSQNEDQTWFSCRKSDNKLIVTVAPNYSNTERIGELMLFSPKDHFPAVFLNVWQEAAEVQRHATSAAERYDFDSEGGVYSFSIFTDAEWSISTEAAWLTLEKDLVAGKASIIAEANTTDNTLSGTVTVTIGAGESAESLEIPVTQGTRADNPYYKLCGKWEITASKWYYSPNGSLNSLDYAPNASQYYLIFDIEEGVYGESLVMRNFLYPGTKLEVRYDAESGGFTIPFGWTVLSYNVFFYVTMVSSSQFSYASIEVPVIPSVEHTALTPKMPSVSGFNYIGFGLWTYNDNGIKVAFGSSYRPTMFPMGDILFRKAQ